MIHMIQGAADAVCWAASRDIRVLLTTGVEADLVHNGDAGLLGGTVELQHCRADVAGGDDMLLLTDGGLDDLGVEGVWDQGDDEVVLGDSSVEGLCVVDIESLRLGGLDAGGQVLGGLEGPAGCCEAARPSKLALGGAREGRKSSPDADKTSLAPGGLGECGRQRGGLG